MTKGTMGMHSNRKSFSQNPVVQARFGFMQSRLCKVQHGPGSKHRAKPVYREFDNGHVFKAQLVSKRLDEKGRHG